MTMFVPGIKTKIDPRTGRKVNDLADANWHLTVLMGHNTDNLIVHDRLQFDCAVIRAGLHNKRNQHDSYGTIQTKNDPRTGRKENDFAEAGWYITALMGHDTDNLIIHGHFYVVWDNSVSGGFRTVRNNSERKHVPQMRRGLRPRIGPWSEDIRHLS
ncbi:hypothetical protein B0T20DRAFT_476954 [Sordaria brevicollis]|uniref:Uncharacterized protein n=1 Tax=Sordaria brevicollis TaxID=83679 RepID=A0AAE0PJ60_SORBR|nr:hypothetical protein B0T20DRAFT_476954 [Sordaria brevicollis]